MPNKAIIVGASGLIGSDLLQILLQESFYTEVTALVRKELPVKHQKLKQLVVDFDKLNDYGGEIDGHALFCCLGTTKKKTPDMAVYRKIDHDYPVQLAEIAARNGVEQYHLVSSMGANAAASNYYLKFKGETEDDIKKSGMKCIQIYQPAMLMGDRKEFRLSEKIFAPVMKVIDLFLIGGLKKYSSIKSKTVAKAMYNQSLKTEEGVFVHQSDQIKLLA